VLMRPYLRAKSVLSTTAGLLDELAGLLWRKKTVDAESCKSSLNPQRGPGCLNTSESGEPACLDSGPTAAPCGPAPVRADRALFASLLPLPAPGLARYFLLPPRGEDGICRRILSALPLSNSSSANTPRTHFRRLSGRSPFSITPWCILTQFLAACSGRGSNHLFTLGTAIFETGCGRRFPLTATLDRSRFAHTKTV